MDGCNAQRILIYYKEWCLGSSTNSKREVSCLSKVDIQNKTFNKQKYW